MQSYYDIWLVSLSVVLAIFASFTALSLAAKIPHIKGPKARYWLLGGALSMGLGIWSMHFIGMLAFHLPIPLAYDLSITVASVLIAILVSGLALYLIRHGIRGAGQLLASAVLMGLGITSMHYTGMEALRMSPAIDYDLTLVALSFAIAVFASLFAINLTFQRDDEQPLLFSGKNFASAVLMGVAIAGMHYVGMEAAYFRQGSVCLAAPSGIDTSVLAALVASVTLLLLISTLVMLTYDMRMAEQNALMVEELHRRNLALQQEAEALAHNMTENIREHAHRDRLLATIVEQSSEAIITTDLDGRISSWNRAAENVFGYRDDEVLGQPITLLDDPAAEHDHPVCSPYGGDEEHYVSLRHRDGERIFLHINRSPLRSEEGESQGEIVVMYDVTQQKQDRDQLLLWSLVYEHSGEAIVITDGNNRILSVNHAFTRITGYPPEEVIGQNPSLLSSGRHDRTFYQRMWGELEAKGFYKGEVWNRRKNGDVYPEWITITALRDDNGHTCNYIAIFSDASDYKEKEARIQHMAHHDALTGLPNRSLLQDRLEQAMAHAKRRDEMVALLFIDLDRFKLINDTLGHHIGDALLVQVAERLTSTVRSDDTVCRQGGDEFIIVLQEMADCDSAGVIAEKLLEVLSAEYLIEGESLKVTPSIGISLFPDDGIDIDTLIKNADTAMYHAKDQGRANIQFFTASLNEKLTERMELEKALSEALANDGLELHYQPQVNLNDGRVSGVEALLRWNHPQKGAISPARFIPIAEESGLIEEVGQWVLEEVLKQQRQWRDGPLSDLRISLNVSARQLQQAHFVEAARELVEHYAPNMALLELEVTETAVMQNVVRSVERLAALKGLGFDIAVDDFGTGYSSLNYLKRLPIDRLKIDRSFIGDIPDDPNDIVITEAIIRLAQTLGLELVAEGVETEEQAEFLRESGCELAQGFLYARALPPAELETFVAERGA